MKNSVKLGKTAKNRLKIKEKAEILAQENEEISWKEELSHPWNVCLKIGFEKDNDSVLRTVFFFFFFFTKKVFTFVNRKQQFF